MSVHPLFCRYNTGNVLEQQVQQVHLRNDSTVLSNVFYYLDNKAVLQLRDILLRNTIFSI